MAARSKAIKMGDPRHLSRLLGPAKTNLLTSLSTDWGAETWAKEKGGPGYWVPQGA